MSQLFVFDINEIVILLGVLLGIFIPVNIWRVKREVKENNGGFENKWITGHSGDSKTIEKTILLNTLTKRKLKYSGKMYIVLYRMQIWTKIV